MKVLLFGASGMVGQGVLRECLADPRVTDVVCVVRRPLGVAHAKATAVLLPDLADIASTGDQLSGFHACFFCSGTTAAGLSETQYTAATYDLTLRVASLLASLNPGMTFVYVSGAGTDSTERGRFMWARVKGRTENALQRLPFKAAYMFRPGAIQPLHGITSRTGWYRVVYAVTGPLYPLLRRVFPDAITTTEAVGRAMLAVAYDGYPSRILETRDINRAAERWAPG